MRRSALPAVLAALVLALAACGGGAEDGATEDTSPTPTATEGASAADLDGGVAAVVNGEEIPAELLDSRVDTAAEAPQLAEVLEGENGEQARAQLRASILSQLIVNRIVVDGADERGLTIDDQAIAETREELTEQAGGEDAFDEQVEAAGLDEGQLTAELEAITALRLVRDDLAGGEAPERDPDATTPDPADAALQEWLVEQLREAEIVVAPEIGRWDPAQGTIVPTGAAAPPAPAQAPAGDGGAGAPTAPTTPSPAATEG